MLNLTPEIFAYLQEWKNLKSQMISDVLEKSGKQAHMAGQQYGYKETREKNIQTLKLMVHAQHRPKVYTV